MPLLCMSRLGLGLFGIKEPFINEVRQREGEVPETPGIIVRWTSDGV